jgi:hypothetical protein
LKRRVTVYLWFMVFSLGTLYVCGLITGFFIGATG